MGLRAGILSFLVAALLAVGCCAPPALAALPSPGTLTDHEFTLLSASRLGLDSALRNRGQNWTAAARNACLTLAFGASTPLLASEKVDCLASVTLELALDSFQTADAKCTTRGQRGKVFCQAPLYKALARDAADAYASDLKERQTIVRRGFTGACLATLAPSQKQLRDNRGLVAASKQVSADIYVLVNIAHGRAPPSRLTQSRVDAHSSVLEREINKILLDSSPDNLNSCPHQAV
jgi:hypothetical protein